MIHVCFGLHDADGRYSKFVGTTMASIFENTTSPVTIHILHDATLTADNRDKFLSLTEKYNQLVEFHNVEELCPDEINFLREKLADKIKSRFSSGAFYRLLIKKILGTGKIIYLDADIIVNLDINELWQQNLQNFPVAAVPEIEATLNHMITNKFLLNKRIVKLDNYFCSGVMIFNLDKLEEKIFYDGVKFLADNPACESVDQDILNAFFSENYFKLVQKFDAFVCCERGWKLPVRKKIYHYAGQDIGLNLNDVYNRLFMENFTRTPWFNIDAISRLTYKFFEKHNLTILRAQTVIRLCAERKRAFFVDPQNLKAVKKMFSIHDDELILESHSEDSINELITKMRDQRGKMILFICLRDYQTLGMELIRCGFNEFQDFVNGLEFMTPDQYGCSFSEYEFIKAL